MRVLLLFSLILTHVSLNFTRCVLKEVNLCLSESQFQFTSMAGRGGEKAKRTASRKSRRKISARDLLKSSRITARKTLSCTIRNSLADRTSLRKSEEKVTHVVDFRRKGVSRKDPIPLTHVRGDRVLVVPNILLLDLPSDERESFLRFRTDDFEQFSIANLRDLLCEPCSGVREVLHDRAVAVFAKAEELICEWKRQIERFSKSKSGISHSRATTCTSDLQQVRA